MKKIFLLVFCLPFLTFAQFGFERADDIEVYKSNIQQKYPWVGGLDYCNFSNIDLDLDGVLDLFIFDKSGSKVITFIQKGSDGQMDFEYAPEYEESFPRLQGWAILVDYDGDGKKDVYTSSPGGASVYKNISTPLTGLQFELSKLWLPTTYDFGGPIIETFVSVGQGDLPAIIDVDNDGDVDILAFYFNNNCIRYYKNLSQELYNHADSLTFRTVNVCYGNIIESNTANQIFMDSCCGNQVDASEGGLSPRPVPQVRDRHAGSSLLSLDLNADGMQDLLIGDIAYNTLTRMLNASPVPNTNIDLVSPDYSFPSYDTPVNLPLFPAPSHVDVNNDGERDLIISPNLPMNSQNYRGNWMYLNNDVDNNPDFEFQTEGFLQGDMIDGGSESYPVYFDYNGDGLKDLVVSISERYDSISTNGYSRLLYYENTGTSTNAEFTLVSEDFLNLSTFNNVNHLFYRPAFGDVDGDGDEDMLLSDLNDTMYFFENGAGASLPAQFISPVPFKNTQNVVVSEGIQVTPKFVDLDRDGKVDLVLGKRNGTISYYRNIGIGNSYSFNLVTANLGGVDVSEWWTIEGVAVPEFVDIDGEWHLICGARNGFLHYYNQIDNNLTGNFNLVDSTLGDIVGDIYTGTYSTPAVLDIDGDNRLEMLIGNKRGGLSFYRSDIITNVGITEFSVLDAITIYPNPADNQFFIDLSKLKVGSYNQVSYNLMDITGKSILTGKVYQTKTAVDTELLSNGVYFLSLNINGQTTSRKIVIN